MKILVIGSGGREHALCWSLRQTAGDDAAEIFCAPASDGIAQVARRVPVGATDTRALAGFAAEEKIRLTIVGGEAPLAAGLVDEFESRGLTVAGPRRVAARLESSKVFAKEFMERQRVPTARFRVAESLAEAREILRRGEFGAEDAPVVVKADGLAAGKGVVVAATRAEAELAVEELVEGGRVGAEAARRIILEETLEGREASLLLWTDGRDYALMPAARDHKRIGDGDTGPNTGGMGAITAPGVLDEAMLATVVREIVEPTLEGARREGLNFRGVLFIGLMLTRQGPRVLEYNVRFGDPEAQAILVRLRTNLAEIFDAVAQGTLARTRVEWTEEASACVVLAARGYPSQPETGARIEGLERVRQEMPAVRVFHAGTAHIGDNGGGEGDGGGWQTAGGRVLGLTATGPTLPQALRQCYDAARLIRCEGIQYRRDIGQFREAK
ncbi:MAG TPA: phosphoribosylamine--glycine ligase [Pyrinomonadaceae bacterium]|jgi:phosphoribosylamine--glycine ligase|nr:phosphoribosylamine--glycine ligase [Pyrinomonadaceae bacterium]